MDRQSLPIGQKSSDLETLATPNEVEIDRRAGEKPGEPRRFPQKVPAISHLPHRPKFAKASRVEISSFLRSFQNFGSPMRLLLSSRPVSLASCRFAFVLASCLAAASTTGCSEYWWQRGQPPSVSTLLARSNDRFASAKQDYADARKDIVPAFTELNQNLDGVVELISKKAGGPALTPRFESLAQSFLALEGKLSPGSRPAYGELSGQLRAFMEDSSANKPLSFPPFGLFAARTKSFMASELSVPPPVS